MMHMDRIHHIVAASLAVLSMAGHVQGQTTQPQNAPSAAADQTVETTSPADDVSDVRPGQRVLLREGSQIVEARGIMRLDDETNWWEFVLEPQAPAYIVSGMPDEPLEMLLLPCALVDEMQRIVTSMTDREITFEITGEVYNYHDYNYLLPTHAPRLAAFDERTDSSADQDNPDDDTETTDGDGGDSAEDILRNLDAAIGPVSRSVTRSTTDTLPTARSAAALAAEELVREGEMVIDRRGRMMRAPTGAWMFIFDADAQGEADPPMILLPCLLVEKMEEHATVGGSNAIGSAMIITGPVYLYGDQNYVLPTAFRIPVEQTVLRP